jgi:hypothetical protein
VLQKFAQFKTSKPHQVLSPKGKLFYEGHVKKIPAERNFTWSLSPTTIYSPSQEKEMCRGCEPDFIPVNFDTVHVRWPIPKSCALGVQNLEKSDGPSIAGQIKESAGAGRMPSLILCALLPPSVTRTATSQFPLVFFFYTASSRRRA